ncbi:putative cell wall-binding protein [Evansella vedderi]|uniref:Cell wall-binding protein n=1 Tax=Evansella vedderi TaxID=38282 RepID=A0ABT9ZWI2_9BACI|nr:cell wall-binding repeat-containing protein [Evansella vedderi]MDQ0254500.1 putative cell wall-binding protein [Evansella vedderi]
MLRVKGILTAGFVFLLLFAIVYTNEGSIISASEQSKITIINEEQFYANQESTFETSAGLGITIDNKHEIGQVFSNGSEVSSIEFGYIDRITEFELDGEHYLLIENRNLGSGSVLQFQLFYTSNEEAILIYESGDLPNGNVKLEGATIEVSIPQFKEEDIQTAPTEIVMQQLQINGQQIVELEPKVVGLEEVSAEEQVPQFQLFSASKTFQNPSPSEINQLLTEKALENNIPPEVLKAIAWQESGWQQFWLQDHPTHCTNQPPRKQGEPVIGCDGRGIGILQVTPGATDLPDDTLENREAFKERLKYDIEYNIDMGIQVLLQKWRWTGNILPRVNDGNWRIIDNWYFAIMAYNGMGRVNDPLISSNRPFQDRIYSHMRLFGQLADLKDFPKNQLNVHYRENSPNVMRFTNKMQYTLASPLTPTKHLFKNGDKVRTTATALTLRSTPGGAGVQGSNGNSIMIPYGEVITITGDFKYQDNRNNQFVWYPVRRSNGQTGYVASSYLEDPTVKTSGRMYGQTRYETAVLISQQGWNSSDTVVLARGDDFPDALTGAPLAYQLDAPMLLTRTNRLDNVTIEEIKRLGAKKVVILGGELAISQKVENDLKKLELEIDRIAGNTRFDTAKLIADRLGSQHDQVIVINVDAYADAMAIAPYAARNGIPILLTNRTSIPNVTKGVLNKAKETIVLGGNLVISDSVLNQLPSIKHHFDGKTRFDTAVQIVEELNLFRKNGYLVTGYDFADGLTSSVLAAKHGDSIILTNTNSLPNVSRNLMNEFTHITMLGGHLAISDRVVNEVRQR